MQRWIEFGGCGGAAAGEGVGDADARRAHEPAEGHAGDGGEEEEQPEAQELGEAEELLGVGGEVHVWVAAGNGGGLRRSGRG